MTRVVLVLLLFLLAFAPFGAASHSQEVVRFYEVAGSVAYGSEQVSAYRCLAGQDTPVDAGACTAYHVGPVDFRDHLLVVRVMDDVFGTSVWVTAVVDMDGDVRVDCTIDLCASGEGAVAIGIPANAGGRYVQAFPAVLHMSDVGCCPDGNFGTRGEVSFAFSPLA